MTMDHGTCNIDVGCSINIQRTDGECGNIVRFTIYLNVQARVSWPLQPLSVSPVCFILSRFSLSFASLLFHSKEWKSLPSILVSDPWSPFFSHFHSLFHVLFSIPVRKISFVFFAPFSLKKTCLLTCPISFFFSFISAYFLFTRILRIFIALSVSLFLWTRFCFRVFRSRCYDVGPNRRVIVTRGFDRRCSFVVIDRSFVLYVWIYIPICGKDLCAIFLLRFARIFLFNNLNRSYLFSFFVEVCFLFYRSLLSFPNVFCDIFEFFFSLL